MSNFCWNNFIFIVRSKCTNISIVCRMHWLCQNTVNEMDVQELHQIEFIATTLCSCNERTFGNCKSFLSTHSNTKFNSISTWWENNFFFGLNYFSRLDMSRSEAICELEKLFLNYTFCEDTMDVGGRLMSWWENNFAKRVVIFVFDLGLNVLKCAMNGMYSSWLHLNVLLM